MIRCFLDNLWRWKCGLPEKEETIIAPLEELKQSEWSPVFEQLMRNRLIMGSIRYGRLCAHGKPQLDRIGSMLKRLNLYTKTGNMELLVDIANMCLLEFMEGNHPTRHFHAVDDGEHINIIS